MILHLGSTLVDPFLFVSIQLFMFMNGLGVKAETRDLADSCSSFLIIRVWYRVPSLVQNLSSSQL